VAKVIEAHVVAGRGDLSFIDREECTDGKFSNGVFEGAAEEEEIRSSETVVGVAGEHRVAVDVGAADGGREVEGHDASAVCDRLGQEGAQVDRSFELLGGGDDWARDSRIGLGGCGSSDRDVAICICAGAVVGAIVDECSGTVLIVLLRQFFGEEGVERNLVVEIAAPATKGVLTVAGCDVLLELEKVIEAQAIFEGCWVRPGAVDSLKIVPIDGMEESVPGRTEGKRPFISAVTASLVLLKAPVKGIAALTPVMFSEKP
jgi:hypothetical protein